LGAPTSQTDDRQTTDNRQTTDGRLVAYRERNVVRSLKTLVHKLVLSSFSNCLIA